MATWKYLCKRLVGTRLFDHEGSIPMCLSKQLNPAKLMQLLFPQYKTTWLVRNIWKRLVGIRLNR